MSILRCTQKVLKRLGGESPPGPAPIEGPLGEWYCNVRSLPFRGRSVVLFVNARTLLTVLVPGRGSPSMLPVFRARVDELYRSIGLPEHFCDQEAKALDDLRFGRTLDRSVLGSMTEIAFAVDDFTEMVGSYDAIHWGEIELKLADYLHSPLGYDLPREVALSLSQETKPQGPLAKILPFRPRS